MQSATPNPLLPEGSVNSRDASIDASKDAPSAGRVWAAVIGTAILAGLAAWLGGEVCLNLIKPRVHAASSRGIVLKLTGRREIAVADARNAGVAFAILGAAFGAGMGLAG